MTSWSFLPCRAPRPAPVANDGDAIVVEPNDRGGWSLRFENDPPADAFGNYATAQDAEHVARLNVTSVRVVHPEPAAP